MNLSIRQMPLRANCVTALPGCPHGRASASASLTFSSKRSAGKRERKLNMCTTVYVLIAMSLFAGVDDLGAAELDLRPAQWWPEDPKVPRTSALSSSSPVGVVPLCVDAEVCHRWQHPRRRGVRFGYRLI